MNLLGSLKDLVIPTEPLFSREGPTVLLMDEDERAVSEALLEEIEADRIGADRGEAPSAPAAPEEPVTPSGVYESIGLGDQFFAKVVSVSDTVTFVLLDDGTAAELTTELAEGPSYAEAGLAPDPGSRFPVTVISIEEHEMPLVVPSDHPVLGDQTPAQPAGETRRRRPPRAKPAKGPRGYRQKSRPAQTRKSSKRPADS